MEICSPSDEGGLGIRPLNVVNWAFMANLLCRLLPEPDCLCTGVMKHKYFPQESALRVQVKASDSFAWKAISGARPLIREGLAFFIGSGENTK